MFDISEIENYPQICNFFVAGEFEFLDLGAINRVGWWRLGLIKTKKRRRKYLPTLRPEDDLQHVAHLSYLTLAMEENFGNYMPDVNWHDEFKASVLHEVCEVTTGDTPATKGTSEERRAKKALDERLNTKFIERYFPHERQAELLRLNHVFSDVDGDYAENNTTGVLDACCFLFRIAWAYSRGCKDRLRYKVDGLRLERSDLENIEAAGTTNALDAVWAGMLRGKASEYAYFPIICALTNAHYRACGMEVPESLLDLYPYEIR